MATTDPPRNETQIFFVERRVAIKNMRGIKVAEVYNINEDMLPDLVESMIHGLHEVLPAMWQFSAIRSDWKRMLVILIWNEKGSVQL